MDEINFSYTHEADRDIFREALAHTEAVTGFSATLIEKDYYCSLVLQYLFHGNTSLVFKGGTCISKVYADFYRLSEDIDLIIPVAGDENRNQRSAEMEPVKQIFNILPTVVPGMEILEAFRGHNESRQYIGYLKYQSAVIKKQERVKLEIGIREPLLDSPVSSPVRTIVVNPFSGRSLLPTFTVHAMTMREAYAEKVRAALTRKEPAIRDYFDLFYAVRVLELDFHDRDFLRMVRTKLKIPGNEPVDISEVRKRELARQVEGQLKPVLRPTDLKSFSLDQAFALARSIAEAISDI